ncbi:hypothetical protein KUTeg_015665 [Tegillarca granosa]|uniref:Outer dynein arm-docking complex subunit 4 n=1 Tax=Tegillarca granosa TaxID=220873 RepID=A0ABQ9ENP1_TEGGR|nr:hypothetical protein KUTeg_015665 [Tegillarca granosa]
MLFESENYELSLMYYQRGFKQYPKHTGFQEGIRRCEHAIQKGKKGKKGRRMKLSAAGDMTYLLHKMSPPKAFTFENKSKAKTSHLPKPSATFTTRPLCQLIRIHKTPKVELLRDLGSNVGSTAASMDSLYFEEKKPDPNLVKSTLGVLYADKKYLEDLVTAKHFPDGELGEEEDNGKKTLFTLYSQVLICLQLLNKLKYLQVILCVRTFVFVHLSVKAFNGGRGSPVADMAEDGLNFLYDRVLYWDRLGPLPPPHPSRRSRGNKFGGSMSSVVSAGTNKTSATTTTGDTKLSWKSKNIKSKLGIFRDTHPVYYRPDPTRLNFQFKSITGSSEFGLRNMSEIPEEEEALHTERSYLSTDQRTSTDTGQTVTDYLKRTLADIKDENLRSLVNYERRHFNAVIEKCETCLGLLERYSEDKIPEKHEITANINALLGNTAMHLGNFDEALQYHEIDLNIGEEYDIEMARSRALGNIGKCHMMRGKYRLALEVFNRKAPLCKLPAEQSALFHDIGNCFLVLNHHSFARDVAKKALQTGEESNNRHLQLQACILLGLAERNLKRYEEAHNCFEMALAHAEILEDQRTEQAMQQALIDINKKMANKIKTNSKEKESDGKSTESQTLALNAAPTGQPITV